MTYSNSDEIGKPASDWRVTAYAFGELEGEELSEFEARLSTDETLQQAVDELKELANKLKGLSGDVHGSEQPGRAYGAEQPGRAYGSEQPGRASIEPNWEDVIATPAEPTLVSNRRKHAGWIAGFLTVAASLIGLLGWQQFQSRDGSVSEIALKAGSQVTYEDDAQITDGASRDEGLERVAEEGDLLDLAALPVSEPQAEESPSGGLNKMEMGDVDFEVALSDSRPQIQLAEQSRVAERAEVEGAEVEVAESSRGIGGEDADGAGYLRSSRGMSGLSIVGENNAGAGGRKYSDRASVEGRFRQSEPSMQQGLSRQQSDESKGISRFSVVPGGMLGGMPGGGTGSGDRFESTTDNPFFDVTQAPLSTFSIDVDTASYSKIRSMLTQFRRFPAKDAVRIEEMINYFSYDYPEPVDEGEPFSVDMEIADCPWAEGHQLARIAIKGRSIEKEAREASNLVFLLDVSGSMDQPNKLPLVRRGLEMLARQLGENDRVAIVVYAGAAGVVLESTTADNKEAILTALDRLSAGGSTHGSQGIQLAYEIAREHFIEGGTNRVILCTDGDFNVGTTGTEQLVSLVENEAKGGVFLSVLGFGTGNLNDAMLEAISGRGNGNYAFIDSVSEARKVLVEQMTGTLLTIAKNVKIQVEFNPTHVQSYRLIGYENRVLAAKDFNDDKKDAGEIGAGHTVTALYELVPRGYHANGVDPLRYQPEVSQTDTAEPLAHQDEVLMLKLRYVKPEESESRLLQFPIENNASAFSEASEDFRFAAAVASFGMLLRESPYKGSATFESVRRMARDAVGTDAQGLRDEFVGLVEQALQMSR